MMIVEGFELVVGLVVQNLVFDIGLGGLSFVFCFVLVVFYLVDERIVVGLGGIFGFDIFLFEIVIKLGSVLVVVWCYDM